MSAKLYPEVDHMALGQRYCDHVLAMTAEGLHAKSDIAGQLAWRDEQLAAKDREIAERDEMIRRLLENRSMRAAIERHEEFAAAALAAISGAGIATPAEGYMKSPGLLPNDIRALAAERDVAQDRAEKAESELDEARECVGRLSAIGEHAKTFIGTFVGENPQTGRSYYADKLWDQLNEALAATPEHLR